MKKVLNFTTLFLFIFFIICTLFLIQIFYKSQQQKFLKIVFLDVGQGDAIFIETPNGFQTLIDAGPDSTVVRSISKFLSFYDRSIDFLIATHSDADHVAGFVDVINRFNIKSFGQNSVFDSDGLNTEINNLIELNKIDKYFLHTGNKIILDEEENIYIEILWPEKDLQEKDNNDNSVITKIVYNEVSVMLTGDASIDIEEKLIQSFGDDFNEKTSPTKNYLKSNILKAGHHGSKTSTSQDFLSIINPEHVIISAGKDNRFGHPHQEVIEIIDDFQKSHEQNKKILETSVLGSIEFRSDGQTIWLVE